MFFIVGGNSAIGAATHRLLEQRGEAVVATTRRTTGEPRLRLDLAAPLEVWQPPAGTAAAVVCAGVARLDACAADPPGSFNINVTQTLVLVDRLLAHGSHVLFLSTDKVFDGTLSDVPADAPLSPASEYGRQKARTETRLHALMAAGAPAAILRLSKVVAPPMPLLAAWAGALRAGVPVRPFADMVLAPVPIDTVARAIAALLATRASGIFQLTGPRDVSYADVARWLAARLGADPALVEPIGARAAGHPEGSTARHTTLDSTALRDRFGIEVPDVWEALEGVLAGAIG